MSHYTEPKALTSFDGASLETPELEVRYCEQVGFEIELRFDQINNSWRQPYTGAQSELNWANLTAHLNTFSAGPSSSLKINSGRLELNDCGLQFSTDCIAFSAHSQEQELYEGINSIQARKFEKQPIPNAPFEATYYKTFVRRFQYQRPKGLILGLPGQTGEFNRNGYRFELYNTDRFVHTPDRPAMYQSWPIVFHQVENHWCAIFFDNPSRTFVDLGEFYPDRVTFEAAFNNLRVYIILGKTLAEVSAKLVTLIGKPICPPRWAFGYQQSRWSYNNSSEIRATVAKFKAEKIPLHAMHFDIDYMQDFKVFELNQTAFSDLSELIQELDQQSVKSICILDPGVKIDDSGQYKIYNELVESKAYLQTKDKEPFIAKVWPGDTLLPDFANPAGNSIWQNNLREWLTKYPFAGVWNDMNEPSNFNGHNKANCLAYSCNGSLELDHNLYGYNMAKASAEAIQSKRADDQLVITRAGYPGVQRFAVAWHGDNQCWWEHLRLALRTAVQYSICGLFFSGADLPGFTGNPTPDLAVRFYQLGAFLPFFRGHSWKFSNRKEPWEFGEEATVLIKSAIMLRESMLDEWHQEYTLASKYGRAPISPVLDSNQNLVDDQFLLFNKYLVAPVLDRGAQQKIVYLPAGTWQRFDGQAHGAQISGDSWLMEAVTLQSIPVFVRI
jgi:alpha-glucosidase